jgi:hypothetical protein
MGTVITVKIKQPKVEHKVQVVILRSGWMRIPVSDRDEHKESDSRTAAKVIMVSGTYQPEITFTIVTSAPNAMLDS